MKKNFIKIIFLFFMILGVILLSSIPLRKNDNDNKKSITNEEPNKEIQIRISEIHNPIYIIGNESFETEDGVSGGNGSLNNPFIIKNLIINTNSKDSCIYIANTTAYFRILNCTLTNSFISENRTTINLNNATNGLIYNNTVSLAPITLSKSHNNTITNNTIHSNSYIAITYSHNNTLLNNTIINNIDKCIDITYSNSTKIIENTIINCSIGIILTSSNNSIIQANNISNCVIGIGIYDNSSYNKITFNSIYNFTLYYIEIGDGCIGNININNFHSQPGGEGSSQTTTDGDNGDGNAKAKELDLTPYSLIIIFSILLVILGSAVLILVHRRLLKKKKEKDKLLKDIQKAES